MGEDAEYGILTNQNYLITEEVILNCIYNNNYNKQLTIKSST